MDQNTTLQVVAGAAVAAGSASDYPSLTDWQLAVHRAAISLAVMARPTSPVGGDVAAMLGEGTKTFIATITEVKKELSSKRGVVYLYTDASRPNPRPQTDPFTKDKMAPGYEFARTDRTDSSPYGKALAIECLKLIGHKVRVHLVMETKSDGTGEGTRVLKMVEDLGVDVASPVPAAAA